MATLGSVLRHSMGDLTLHIFKFTSIGTADSYAVTNSPGWISVWMSGWASTDTLGTMVRFTNSASGGTLSFRTGIAATTADVYVLSHG